MSIRRIITLLLAIQAALISAHFGFGHYAPMAIVFVEGFDTTNAAADLIQKGWTGLGSYTAGTGRLDGRSAVCSGNTGAQTWTHVLPSSYATLIVGMAVNQTSIGNGAFDIRAGATRTVRIQTDASGHYQILNSAGTVLATGTTVVTNSTWHYVEVKAFVNGASGTVELHLDGVVEIASTVVNIGSTNLDTIALVRTGTSNQLNWDDIYAADTTGSAPNNTFLGDVRVETVFPDGDGAHLAWTPTGGGAHYTQVNANVPDDDTTYVSDATPGDIDSYTVTNIDGGATVYAVQVDLWARKDDASTRQIAPLIRQASTDYVGNTVTLGTTYSYYQQLYDKDPTAADWTAANINADEFGIKEIA
jgi:hypothetical protein